MLTYGSVCSGIEAATVAWHPLGWTPAFFSEIDRFPRAVLQHHYPAVPLHGDFTTIEAGQYASISVLVGGTPCQSFSVAGLRGGLDDERGNLALEYLRLAQRLRPRWLVWENVPGVLSSSGGRDFGAILGGMVELGYGWAYRVLDAQHFGIPQRRRRVFVVGHLGDRRAAAAVLFERASLSGNPPPRRQAGQSVAGELAGVSPGGGWRIGADEAAAGQLVSLTPGDRGLSVDQAAGGMAIPVDLTNTRCGGEIAGTLGTEQAHGNRGQFVAHAFDARQSDVIQYGDKTGPLDTDGTSIAVAYGIRSDAMREGSAQTPSADAEGRVRLRDPGLGITEEIAPTVDCGAAHAVAFTKNSRSEVRFLGGDGGIVGAVTSEPGAQQQNYVAIPILEPGRRSGRSTDDAKVGLGVGVDGDPMFTLPAERPHGVGTAMGVRRLTPRECERLQGFPDDYTLIPMSRAVRKAVEVEMAAYYRRTLQDLTDEDLGCLASDGPRYKALGNSMAVPVMAWIGYRISMVEQILARLAA